jgi:hypothetical protein
VGDIVDLPPKPGHKRSTELKRHNMADYLEWYTTPKKKRNPSTKTAFAESIGVTDDTLRNYEKERWFQVEANKRMKSAFRIEKAQDVIDNLFDIAAKKWTDNGSPAGPSVSAAKVLIDWMDKSVEDQEADPSSMTDDELVRIYHRLGEVLKDAGEIA